MTPFPFALPAPQSSDYQMTDAQVAEAEVKAREVLEELLKTHPRAVLLWLASYFRRLDYRDVQGRR